MAGAKSAGTAASVANSEGEHVVKLTAQEIELIMNFRTFDKYDKECYTLHFKHMAQIRLDKQKEKPLSGANAKRQELKIFTNDRTVKSL